MRIESIELSDHVADKIEFKHGVTISEVMARLPEFKTPEEFAEFFETHSVADYWEEFEEVTDIEFVRPAEAQAMIPLAVSDSLFKEMQAYAAQEGVSLPALARRWLMAHARELQQARS